MRQQLFSILKLRDCPNQEDREQWVPFFPFSIFVTTSTHDYNYYESDCELQKQFIPYPYTLYLWSWLSFGCFSLIPFTVFISPFFGSLSLDGDYHDVQTTKSMDVVLSEKKIHLLISPLKADLWASITVFENPQKCHSNFEFLRQNCRFSYWF